MRKSGAFLLVLVLVSSPTMAHAADHTVTAVAQRGQELMFFEPNFLRVTPGDTVTFVVDDLDHQPQSVFVPTGAKSWQAAKGQSITVELDAEGVYIFDCAYHNVMGMTGVIVVGEATNLVAAHDFYARYREEAVFINRARLDPVWYLENSPLKLP
ncbi:MAG: plastocyanin/azurin family copper-binding protein [Pseudomonadota bacterium]